MDKIKKEFENEKGKVNKDDEGRIKLLEVVDWNVSEGLKGGEELSDLFKWEEKINN